MTFLNCLLGIGLIMLVWIIFNIAYLLVLFHRAPTDPDWAKEE